MKAFHAIDRLQSMLVLANFFKPLCFQKMLLLKDHQGKCFKKSILLLLKLFGYRVTVRESGQFINVEVADLKLSVQWDRNNGVTINLDKKWKEKVSVQPQLSYIITVMLKH
jgi:hypothetical protein